MTYEPYLPWTCDVCGRLGRVAVPAEADLQEREFRVEEAHAIATEGSCPAPVLRTGQIVQPDIKHPLRAGPSQLSLL
jgi:hypothetical protein